MKRSSHKYQVGAIVGTVVDCMAECEIIKRLPKKRYVLKVVKVAHPEPKESWFGKNPRFTADEKQILVQLRMVGEKA